MKNSKKALIFTAELLAGTVLILGLNLKGHFGRGFRGFARPSVRDVGWEARLDHWKDNKKKMYWEIVNLTDEFITVYSDEYKVLIRPEKKGPLPREADFTVTVETDSGLTRKLNTRKHFIKVFMENESLKIKAYRTWSGKMTEAG